MPDERQFYLPWYEASPEGLDDLALIKRTVDRQIAEQSEVRR
jgi:hypothetical protein